MEDWPDVAVRGVMLDVSRDKVPTIATLEALIDRLAAWKVNHVELYMEHTFAYAGHRGRLARVEPVHGGGDPAARRVLPRPLRRAHAQPELPRALRALAAARPVQAARHRARRTRPMPEAGRARRRPRAHAPRGRSTLMRRCWRSCCRLLVAAVACTSGSTSRGSCRTSGSRLPRLGDRRCAALPELDGRQLLDVGRHRGVASRAAGAIPDGVTVCEWGYEDGHPFAAAARRCAACGRPFWPCPGTSSWLTLARPHDEHGRNIARGGRRRRRRTVASGVLITDWGDNGHLQYLPISEPGFAFGAAVSWCAEANRDLDLAAALSAHSFDDPTGGRGGGLASARRRPPARWRRRCRTTPSSPCTSTGPFPDGRGRDRGLRDEDLAAVESSIAEARARLAAADVRRPVDGPQVVAELDTSARLLSLLVRDARAAWPRAARSRRSISDVRMSFADELEGLVDEHRRPLAGPQPPRRARGLGPRSPTSTPPTSAPDHTGG